MDHTNFLADLRSVDLRSLPIMNMGAMQAIIAATSQGSPLDLAAIQAMNAAPTVGNGSGYQGGTGFNVNVYEAITGRAYDVKFPELFWSKTIPTASIDTSVPLGADSTSYTAKDRRGKAAFRSMSGKNIPTVGLSIGKVEIPIEEGAIMANIDLHEIEKIMMGHSINIVTEHGETMRRASEVQIEDVFFFGYPELNFAGYLDYPYTPATTAATKAATGTTWAVATPQELAADVNTALATVYINSRGLHRANRIELPVTQYLQLANTMMSVVQGAATISGAISVLAWLKQNNSTTQLTGQELDIRPLIYLTGAGAGGTNRMIVSDDSADNHYMPMSLPFTVLPQQNRGYAIELFSRWRFGSYHKPYPAATLYMDGI